MTPFLIGGILLIYALVSYPRNNRIGLFFLVLGSFCFGLAMALLDPFLNLWDEQFHALVAKNITQSPFEPMLYSQPVIGYSFENWTANHVWLHKPPLFLWQMGLSIQCFGENELAVRLPSVIMHTLTTLLIFRIGKKTLHHQSAFYAAFLFSCAFYPLENVVGRFASDHNDAAFLFYVTASFWAWFNFKKTSSPWWLICIGLFSGAAVMIKWLMGLVVFVVWGTTRLLTERKNLFLLKSHVPMTLAFLVALLVFLPWQIHIHSAFSREADYESKFALQHFLHAVENHSGSWSFYFTRGLQVLYGSWMFLPFLLLAIVVIWKKVNESSQRVFIITTIGFVYLFYSIAATKMPAFVIIAMPFIFLGFGAQLRLIVEFVSSKLNPSLSGKIASIVLPLLLGYIFLHIAQIEKLHTPRNRQRTVKLREREFIRNLPDAMHSGRHIIFNSKTSPFGHVPIMFYHPNPNLVAIQVQAQKNYIAQAKTQGYRIWVLNKGNVPDFVTADVEITLLPWPYED